MLVQSCISTILQNMQNELASPVDWVSKRLGIAFLAMVSYLLSRSTDNQNKRGKKKRKRKKERKKREKS